MTQIQYDIKIAVDIHGTLVILEELNSSILKETDSLVKLLRGNTLEENLIQPLDDFLNDFDLDKLDDDYRSFRDNNDETLFKGGIYTCFMIWTHLSSFNGDTTEYESDYELKNFILIK